MTWRPMRSGTPAATSPSDITDFDVSLAELELGIAVLARHSDDRRPKADQIMMGPNDPRGPMAKNGPARARCLQGNQLGMGTKPGSRRTRSSQARIAGRSAKLKPNSSTDWVYANSAMSAME